MSRRRLALERAAHRLRLALITSISVRAAPDGRRAPSSHLRTVPTPVPMTAANSRCDRPADAAPRARRYRSGVTRVDDDAGLLAAREIERFQPASRRSSATTAAFLLSLPLRARSPSRGRLLPLPSALKSAFSFLAIKRHQQYGEAHSCRHSRSPVAPPRLPPSTATHRRRRTYMEDWSLDREALTALLDFAIQTRLRWSAGAAALLGAMFRSGSPPPSLPPGRGDAWVWSW